jgi:hypothetical protein
MLTANICANVTAIIGISIFHLGIPEMRTPKLPSQMEELYKQQFFQDFDNKR